MSEMHDRILEALTRSDNEAADQALGSALLADDGRAASPLATALLRRGTDDALSYVARAYHKLDHRCQQILLRQCSTISAALRLAIRDETPQAKINVIDLAAAGSEPRLAYILTFLLHDDVPTIRARAAKGLCVLAGALVDRLESDGGLNQPDDATGANHAKLMEDLHQYSIALRSALDSFPVHLRTEVVEAMLKLGPYLNDDIWGRVIEPKNRIGRAAMEILQRQSNPSFAGFAFRALTSEELGRTVARLIAADSSAAFMREWLKYSWYRFDTVCQKHLAWIKEFRWLADNAKALLESPPELQIRFVDLLMATSMPMSQKLHILDSLLTGKDFGVQDHVVTSLIGIKAPEAKELLSLCVSLESTRGLSVRACRMAARHLHWLDPDRVSSGWVEDRRVARTGDNMGDCFDDFWKTLEGMDTVELSSAAKQLLMVDTHFLGRLQEKLQSSIADERIKAVSLVRKAHLAREFSTELCRLCHDVNAFVRASAVAALAELSGPQIEQTIVEALDDVDPRVQANAIESLEALSPPDLLDALQTKLNSANNRIRANAIKAIFKPQHALALRALAIMLEHPDPAFRVSALWAVSRATPLHLVATVTKLAKNDPDPQVKAMAQQAMVELVRTWRESRKTEAQLVQSGV